MTAAAAAAGCERVVLVVEDDRDVRDSITEALDDNEFQTMAAANGQDALDQLRTAGERPCLILLDIMMPVMDGWQFRAQQTADPKLGEIPVVVITAHASARQVAQQMGAAGFLTKPLALESLLAIVHRHCDEDETNE